MNELRSRVGLVACTAAGGVIATATVASFGVHSRADARLLFLVAGLAIVVIVFVAGWSARGFDEER
jgi:hypothetical protein